jgi:hypothetical protein
LFYVGSQTCFLKNNICISSIRLSKEVAVSISSFGFLKNKNEKTKKTHEKIEKEFCVFLLKKSRIKRKKL